MGIEPDHKWLNELTNRLYYSKLHHPRGRHLILITLKEAFERGVAAARDGESTEGSEHKAA